MGNVCHVAEDEENGRADGAPEAQDTERDARPLGLEESIGKAVTVQCDAAGERVGDMGLQEAMLEESIGKPATLHGDAAGERVSDMGLQESLESERSHELRCRDLNAVGVGVGGSESSSKRSLALTVGDDRLRRGTSVAAVLYTIAHALVKAPRSLRSLAGKAFTEDESRQLWDRSMQVERLDTFVSHCWHDSAVQKIIALLLHYNGRAAMILSALVPLCVPPLYASGLLWTFQIHTAEGDCEYGLWATLFGLSTFVAAFTMWHRVPVALGGSRGKRLFFDQLCVHQTDLELKHAGIQAIGGFVAESEHLLLIWSPSYFKRLWCTLEVAALSVSTRQASKSAAEVPRLPLVFMSQQLAATVIKMILVFMALVGMWVSISSISSYASTWATFCSLLVLLPFYIHSLRSYMRGRVGLTDQLEQFSVERAECFSAEDRPLLQGTIEHWFGTLQNYDEHVRTSMSVKVREAIGSEFRLPLYFFGIGQLPIFWHHVDLCTCTSKLPHGEAHILSGVVTTYLLVMATNELCLLLSWSFAQRRWWVVCDVLVSVIIAVFVTFGGSLLHLLVSNISGIGVLHAFAALGCVLLLLVLTHVILPEIVERCRRHRQT